jgi:hypothetical protein
MQTFCDVQPDCDVQRSCLSKTAPNKFADGSVAVHRIIISTLASSAQHALSAFSVPSTKILDGRGNVQQEWTESGFA